MTEAEKLAGEPTALFKAGDKCPCNDCAGVLAVPKYHSDDEPDYVECPVCGYVPEDDFDGLIDDCPSCGSFAHIINQENIICSGCGLEMTAEDEEAAIKVWNAILRAPAATDRDGVLRRTHECAFRAGVDLGLEKFTVTEREIDDAITADWPKWLAWLGVKSTPSPAPNEDFGHKPGCPLYDVEPEISSCACFVPAPTPEPTGDCSNCDMPKGSDGGCHNPYCDAPDKPTSPAPTVEREALVEARQGIQAFLDMVNVIQKWQALPIPTILETAQHNCPILLAKIDAALKETPRAEG